MVICSTTEQVIGYFNTLDLLNTHAMHCVQFLCLFFFNSTVSDARLISIVHEALKQVVGKNWSTPFYSTPSLALNEWNQRMCRVIYDPVTGKCLLSSLLLNMVYQKSIIHWMAVACAFSWVAVEISIKYVKCHIRCRCCRSRLLYLIFACFYSCAVSLSATVWRFKLSKPGFWSSVFVHVV